MARNESFEPTEVDLGFVEKPSNVSRLASPFFPCKLGGKPAWLNLKNIPSRNYVKCRRCEQACLFLLQLYAPVEGNDACFHRTLFVFCCVNPDCHSDVTAVQFRVLRSQLPRKNEFYSFSPNSEGSAEAGYVSPTLCYVCGLSGPMTCAKCKAVHYCSQDHQRIHWANHKAACQKGEVGDKPLFLFPEWEIVYEAEEIPEAAAEKNEAEKMEDYRKFLQSSKSPSLQNEVSADKFVAEEEGKEDKIFLNFKARVAHNPDQVVRYCKDGNPLWVSAENIPQSKDVEACSCGASRKFEFQILPQLIRYMDVDLPGRSIDWGSLYVFTCSKYCQSSRGYSEEFVWKQVFSNTQ